MGLTINYMESTDHFSAGSYKGFHLWRVELARIVGIDLNEMGGFIKAGKPWTGSESFVELLTHDDNEGQLYCRECEELVDDFEEWENTVLDAHERGSYFHIIYDSFWEMCANVGNHGGHIEFA